MKFWQKILRFFQGPTPEEHYLNGVNMVWSALMAVAPGEQRIAKAQELYHLASGGFNSSEAHRSYDRGVHDAIEKWWTHG